MQRRPRSPHSELLSNRFLLLIGWQGAMLAGITLLVYGWALETYGEGAQARTLTLMTLISVQLGHLFNCRSRTLSAFEGLFRNPFIWVSLAMVITLQMLAIYLKPLARVLGTVELTGVDWLLICLAALAPIAIVEITKLFARRAIESKTDESTKQV
jgi:Ca2+-transporting ATPase